MPLSEDQQRAFDIYLSGANLFITGPGGTGKSVLIRSIYRHARENRKRIQICAMTGVAAANLNIIGAKTIHSWSGIGLGKGKHTEIIEKVATNKYKCKFWRSVDTLVVDEVSMLSESQFELLDKIGRRVRKNDELPFGGIQIIFSGDFHQLPPVSETGFCFQSQIWKKCFTQHDQIVLKKIFRQTNMTYIDILNEIREGKISEAAINLLQERVNIEIPSNIICSKILPTRAAVESINTTELNKLPTDEVSYTTKRVPEISLQLTAVEKAKCKNVSDKQKEFEYAELLRNMICEETVKLKKGAHVMCVVNITQDDRLQICNGSQGIVTDFENGFPVVKYDNGIVKKMTYHNWKSEKFPDVVAAQVPLMLSWAITIHKSQGMTIDNAEIDAGNKIFESGQTYVALSRLRTLEGLYLSSFNPKKIKHNKIVQDYYDSLERIGKE